MGTNRELLRIAHLSNVILIIEEIIEESQLNGLKRRRDRFQSMRDEQLQKLTFLDRRVKPTELQRIFLLDFKYSLERIEQIKTKLIRSYFEEQRP